MSKNVLGTNGSTLAVNAGSGTISDGNNGNNYTLVYQTASGTINPAPLTYVSNPATWVSGVANPNFSGVVTGFVNNETQASATTGALLFSSPANASSPPGSYPINGLGLSAANYYFIQAAGNATALTVDPSPNSPTSQSNPPGNNPPNPGTNISFQNFTSGPINISFTPPRNTATSTQPGSLNDVVTGALPDGVALATNSGHTYLPISQFDPNQYSQFKLPGYEGQAGEAAVFTMIARGADSQHASDDMIDTFWNGTAGTWNTANPILGSKVTFSDGAGNTVVPGEFPGFPIVPGTTNVSEMLRNGPVLISDGGQPAHWLLATQMTADGKGIVANDPSTGKQVVLSYDPGTKTVGGVTGVFDPKTKAFISIADASATALPHSSNLSALQGFVPENFIAVTVK